MEVRLIPAAPAQRPTIGDDPLQSCHLGPAQSPPGKIHDCVEAAADVDDEGGVVVQNQCARPTNVWFARRFANGSMDAMRVGSISSRACRFAVTDVFD